MGIRHWISVAAAAATLGMLSAATHAALSQEELAQLGTTLTPWGAEIAGTPDGSYPAYTGGIKPPCSPSTRPTWSSTRTGSWRRR